MTLHRYVTRFSFIYATTFAGARHRCNVALVHLFFLFFVFTLSGGAAYPAFASLERPLLMQGKQTLFQRVVSKPGAKIYTKPYDAADIAIDQENLPVFSPLYVYTRDDGGWHRVGRTTSKAEGWIREKEVLNWNTALTLVFTPRVRRSPVLFFKTITDLKRFCEVDNIEAEQERLMEIIRRPPVPKNFPVLATEPDDMQGAVAENKFYLMPILSTEKEKSYREVLLLEVACVDGAMTNESVTEGSIGIAFVLDTTISMKPYIEQSRLVIRSIFEMMKETVKPENLNYAVVAFRSSTEATPGIEYRTRKVTDFKNSRESSAFDQALAAVQEAPVSTHSFNEDSLAGIQCALDELDWSPFNSRVIFLITDAGPLEQTDKFASVKMDTMQINELAESKNIKIVTIHIRSEQGKHNHAYARSEYRHLSRSKDGTVFYLDIPAVSNESGAKKYGGQMRDAQTFMSESVQKMNATLSELREYVNRLKERIRAAAEEGRKDGETLGQTLGYALLMDFLGSKQQTAAPEVPSGWIVDMDAARLVKRERIYSVYPAVMVSKGQLSDLQQVLETIHSKALTQRETDSKDFFKSIQLAVSKFANDPSIVAKDSQGQLKDIGVLGEFLHDLPYKSDIMNLTENDWYALSVGEQQEKINRLETLFEFYKEYDRDPAAWVNLGDSGTSKDEYVIRIPLTMLP